MGNCASNTESTSSGRKSSLNKNYTVGEKLGEGAFAKVHLGTHKQTHKKYAIKMITKSEMTPDDALGLKQEITVLKELDHPNVMGLNEVIHEPKFIYLITELLSGGELFDRIVQKEYYSESEARNVSTNIFGALSYCHSHDVAHRDLKPENLLLCSKFDDLDIKLADFGFAKKALGASLRTQCGTPGYVAPEIVTGRPYDTQVDMWSLGVILYILLAGYPPFNGKTQKELFKQIRRGKYKFHDEFWGTVSKEAQELVTHLLTVDPKKRYTADDALVCAWMEATVVDVENKETMQKFRKFNAKRKVKQAVLAHVAAKKMTHFIGLGEDTTFMFTHKKPQLVGVDPPMDDSKSDWC